MHTSHLLFFVQGKLSFELRTTNASIILGMTADIRIKALTHRVNIGFQIQALNFFKLCFNHYKFCVVGDN
jgi:hypothetical protein